MVPNMVPKLKNGPVMGPLYGTYSVFKGVGGVFGKSIETVDVV